MKKITIAGGGVLGSQIAFQAAYCGCDVTVWLRSESSAERMRAKWQTVKQHYLEAIDGMEQNPSPETWAHGIAEADSFDAALCRKRVEQAYESVQITTDLSSAAREAELVIECIAEDLKEKRAFYRMLAPLLPKNAIVVTNSSTLLPSSLAASTGCPSRFLAMHFANSIWRNNVAEVMAHGKTSEASFQAVLRFAEQIRMIPLPVYREKAGYLLNSMLIPLLFSGLDLVATGVSDPVSVDTAWTHGTGAPKGPFRILDTIGLATAYRIVLQYVKIPSVIAPYHFKKIAALLKQYLDAGKTGEASGEGFYVYRKK